MVELVIFFSYLNQFMSSVPDVDYIIGTNVKRSFKQLCRECLVSKYTACQWMWM